MINNSLTFVIVTHECPTAGKYTVLEGVKLLEGLSWGVAGRDEEKLKRTLKEIGDKANKDLSNLPIVIADVRDEKSLQKMAERAKVTICFFPNAIDDVIVYLLNLNTQKYI